MHPSATWAETAAQAIFHTLVASLFVEALVRSWRVREPRQRMALRLAALVYPLALFPALVVLFPLQEDEGLRGAWALLRAERWDELHLLGIGLMRWWVGALSTAGAVLFLMDLVPLVRARRRPRPVGASEERESAAAVSETLAGLAPLVGMPAPPVVFLARDAPVLFCTGIRRHTIVVRSCAPRSHTSSHTSPGTIPRRAGR